MVQSRNYGRCGNVFFQVAMAIAYSLKHGIEFSVQNRTNDEFWNPIYLQHLVNPNWEQGREDIVIDEIGHPYQEPPFKEEWRDKQIVLNGYWQSEKYFKEYRNEIIKLFNLPYTKKEGYVSIHQRRGDYLELSMKHPPITKDWVDSCMNIFPGMKFKFFSDDIQHCKNTWGGRSDCEFSSNTTEIEDLVEMANCEHQICSASTFSWWSMWLNKNENKKVVFPKLWFQPGWDGIDTTDIVPDWCIKI